MFALESSEDGTKSYSFTIHVTDVTVDNEHYEDALYEAGCDDALIAVIDGEMFLDFERPGKSYQEAVNSAVADITKAGGHIVNVTRSL